MSPQNSRKATLSLLSLIKGYVHKLPNLMVGCFGVIPLLLVGQFSAHAAPRTEAVTPNNNVQTLVSPIQDGGLQIPPIGDAMKFLPEEGKINLVLDLSDRKVYVFQGTKQIGSYPVAVGKEGWETPKGDFQVIEMQENPVWQDPWSGEIKKPGPNTALGLRWIGFWTNGKDTIGFHGTPTVDSIGKAASHGCVRMRNEDVVNLFQKVEMGTPVKVVD